MMKKILSIALALALMLMWCAAPAEESAWENILLLGTDLGSGREFGRSDTMIVLSINRETNKVKMTSIMRDTWVHLGEGHGDNKINAATVFGGPDMAMKMVNENFGLDIEKYALVDIAGLVAVIDAIGGIDIEITEAEMMYLNNHTIDTVTDIGMEAEIAPLEAFGMVHLCGAQAVQHARDRMVGSDYQRVERQRAVILAIVNKVRSECDVAELVAIITGLLEHVSTNFTITEIMGLASLAFEIDMTSIEQFRVPADGTYTSSVEDAVWRINADFAENARLLDEFITGAEAAE